MASILWEAFKVAANWFGFVLSLILIFLIPLPSVAKADEPRKKDGELTAPLRGTIVDDQRNPVTDATLTLSGPGYYTTQTDQQGRYEFMFADRPGEYRLEIKSSRWVGIRDYEDLPQISISTDTPIEKNLTLPRAGRVGVTLVDDSGDRIKGVSLYYASLTGRQYRYHSSDKSDEQGRIEIGGLNPDQPRYMLGLLNRKYAVATRVVTVSGVDDIAEYKFLLTKGKKVAGRAICSDGQPATGWRVVAQPKNWRFGVSLGGELIGKDGSFQLQNISEGMYQVSISIPSGENSYSSRVALQSVDLLNAKQPFVLKLDYPSPGSMNYITGKIRWIGKPLDEPIQISATSYEGGHFVDRNFKPGVKEFRVGPTPPGLYRVRCNHPEIEVMNLRKIKNLSDLDHVRVPNEEPIQLVLRVRGKPLLQGLVIDAATKKPIEEFKFRISKLRTLSGPNYVQDNTWHPVRNQQGTLQAQVLGPGIYSISVLAPGYAIKASDPINTDEQPEKIATIQLQPGVAVSGVVVDPDGNPVDGARVVALSMAGGTMPRIHSRFVDLEGSVQTENGEFRFENLPKGIDHFRVTHPDFVFADVKEVVVSHQSKPLKITLARGATIRGQVFDDRGRLQPNVTLFFQDASGYGGSGDQQAGRFGKATTDENGRYEVKHIPEKTCYVSRAEEWESEGVVRQVVFPKQGQVHELNLGGRSRVTGRLIVNGKPLADARLQLGGPDYVFGAMKLYTRTGKGGRLELFGAPAGHWTLYRETAGQRGDWTKIIELDVPADSDLELGDIHQKEGLLTVKCTTNGIALPEKLRVTLQQYDPLDGFGRSVGRPLPRASANEDFQFAGMTPGVYELVTYGAGKYTVRQRVKLTEENLNIPVTFDLPEGTAAATIKLTGEDGEPSDLNSFVLWSEDGRIHAYVSSSTHGEEPGEFRITDMPVGKYSLRRGSFRNAEPLHTFTLKSGKNDPIEVVVAETPARRHARLFITDQQGVYVPCAIKMVGDVDIEQRIGGVFTSLVGTAEQVTIEIDHPGFERLEKKIALLPFGTKPGGQRYYLQLKRRDRSSQ